MDDQIFDLKTAKEWISTIESPNGPRDNDIYPRLKTWIDRALPMEILEIGCGQGVCSDKINLEGRRYYGLEPSSFLLERAQQLYQSKNKNFLLGNAYDLPFSDGRFDAVFSVAVWHLLKDLKVAAAERSPSLDTLEGQRSIQ